LEVPLPLTIEDSSDSARDCPPEDDKELDERDILT